MRTQNHIAPRHGDHDLTPSSSAAHHAVVRPPGPRRHGSRLDRGVRTGLGGRPFRMMGQLFNLLIVGVPYVLGYFHDDPAVIAKLSAGFLVLALVSYVPAAILR